MSQRNDSRFDSNVTRHWNSKLISKIVSIWFMVPLLCIRFDWFVFKLIDTRLDLKQQTTISSFRQCENRKLIFDWQNQWKQTFVYCAIEFEFITHRWMTTVRRQWKVTSFYLVSFASSQLFRSRSFCGSTQSPLMDLWQVIIERQPNGIDSIK